MENRVYKHISRQDDVLLRAVSRVWKARERGRLLERVKALRLEKDAWATWKRNARHKQDLNG
jgi:protein SFI1